MKEFLPFNTATATNLCWSPSPPGHVEAAAASSCGMHLAVVSLHLSFKEKIREGMCELIFTVQGGAAVTVGSMSLTRAFGEESERRLRFAHSCRILIGRGLFGVLCKTRVTISRGLLGYKLKVATTVDGGDTAEGTSPRCPEVWACRYQHDG